MTPPSARRAVGARLRANSGIRLPGTQTKNVGSYENPQDLSFDTYKVVRFSEGTNGDGKQLLVFLLGAVPALPFSGMHGCRGKRRDRSGRENRRGAIYAENQRP